MRVRKTPLLDLRALFLWGLLLLAYDEGRVRFQNVTKHRFREVYSMLKYT